MAVSELGWSTLAEATTYFTNERLETTATGILALGDVNGGPAFTHVAYDDYRIVWKLMVKLPLASVFTFVEVDYLSTFVYWIEEEVSH